MRYKMHVTVNPYPDGRPGELFAKLDKQGSTLSGFLDALAVSISIGLQHGVPLGSYTSKLRHMTFDPMGRVEGALGDEPKQVSSLLDLLGGWLERRFAEWLMPKQEEPKVQKEANVGAQPKVDGEKRVEPPGGSPKSAGGRARAKALTAKQRASIARHAAEVRWGECAAERLKEKKKE